MKSNDMGYLLVGIITLEMLLMNLINDRINCKSYKKSVLTQLVLLLSSGIIGIGFILVSYLLATTWILKNKLFIVYLLGILNKNIKVLNFSSILF
ncbi:MAG: hypothetical protein V7K40_29845 [Nostoc sp.]|uniref:hypothetical protein n=1 Tax=Nostoc sp. TaxID=1180 RepID=UPI002FF7A7BD